MPTKEKKRAPAPPPTTNRAGQQFNVRMTDQFRALFADLTPRACAATGLPVSRTQLLLLALAALAEKYDAGEKEKKIPPRY